MKKVLNFRSKLCWKKYSLMFETKVFTLMLELKIVDQLDPYTPKNIAMSLDVKGTGRTQTTIPLPILFFEKF